MQQHINGKYSFMYVNPNLYEMKKPIHDVKAA